MESSPNVLMIGLDGADKDLVHEWTGAGLLPTLHSLFERATWCEVENPPGLFAGSLWPSFFTGMNPARHGKLSSRQMKSGSYDVHRVTSFDPSCKTLWDLLAGHGKRVALLDTPKAVVSEHFNGLQIFDWGTEITDIDVHSWPPGLAQEIIDRYGNHRVIEEDIAAQGLAGLEKLGAQLLEQLQARTRVMLDLLERERWDLFIGVFIEIHKAGHLAWHLHDSSHPRHNAAEAARIGDIIREVYVATDAALARVMAQADSSTRIVVYSINGMGPSYGANFLLDKVLMAREKMQLSRMRRGLTRLAELGDRLTPGAIYDRLYPLHRGFRRAFSLPVKDWALRKYFRVPSNAIAGGVRINLAGREPDGLVPREEYEHLCQTLREDLSQLVNADTNKSVVRRIILTREEFEGRHSEELPDLLIEWTQDAPIYRLYSPCSGLVRGEDTDHRTGDHRPDGMFFTQGNGPGLGQVARLSIYDLAPTIAAMLGVEFTGTEGHNKLQQLGLQ